MFLDRLLEHWDSLIFPWEGADKEGMFRALCNEAEYFDVKNVADYIVSKGGIELRDNIPMARSPFISTWYEYAVWGSPFLKYLGVLNTLVGVTEKNGEELLEWSGVCFGEVMSEKHNLAWIVSNIFCWTCEPKGGLVDLWLWDNKGNLIEEKEDVLKAISWTALAPMWLSNAFMHCKNTTLETIHPPDKLNRARIKRGKRPLISFKVLDIRPIKRLLETEGELNRVGLKRALHICRGHFKDYTNKGLFGKLHGLYWWDAQTRGEIKAGITLKHYRVLPK